MKNKLVRSGKSNTTQVVKCEKSGKKLSGSKDLEVASFMKPNVYSCQKSVSFPLC